MSKTKKEYLKDTSIKYLVVLQWGCGKCIPCNTLIEVEEHLGKRQFGEGYEIHSPAGLNVSQFIPL